MAEIILNVDVREGVGTGGARAARRAGSVPGILYGGDKAPVAISVNEKDFRKSLYTGKLLGHLVTLKYGDETQPVIAKDVQFDPVSDRPLHFDLMRVDEHAPVKISIPVHFKNADEAPFTRQGGSLEVVRHEVEILVNADSIPEELVVDLTGREMGDTVQAECRLLDAGGRWRWVRGRGVLIPDSGPFPAEWVGTHPKWFVSKWRCGERPGQDA